MLEMVTVRRNGDNAPRQAPRTRPVERAFFGRREFDRGQGFGVVRAFVDVYFDEYDDQNRKDAERNADKEEKVDSESPAFAFDGFGGDRRFGDRSGLQGGYVAIVAFAQFRGGKLVFEHVVVECPERLGQDVAVLDAIDGGFADALLDDRAETGLQDPVRDGDGILRDDDHGAVHGGIAVDGGIPQDHFEHDKAQ